MFKALCGCSRARTCAVHVQSALTVKRLAQSNRLHSGHWCNLSCPRRVAFTNVVKAANAPLEKFYLPTLDAARYERPLLVGKSAFYKVRVEPQLGFALLHCGGCSRLDFIKTNRIVFRRLIRFYCLNYDAAVFFFQFHCGSVVFTSGFAKLDLWLLGLFLMWIWCLAVCFLSLVLNWSSEPNEFFCMVELSNLERCHEDIERPFSPNETNSNSNSFPQLEFLLQLCLSE